MVSELLDRFADLPECCFRINLLSVLPTALPHFAGAHYFVRHSHHRGCLIPLGIETSSQAEAFDAESIVGLVVGIGYHKVRNPSQPATATPAASSVAAECSETDPTDAEVARLAQRQVGCSFGSLSAAPRRLIEFNNEGRPASRTPTRNSPYSSSNGASLN
jgi:hypothetical protein